MTKMRTIDQAHDYLMEKDSETALSKTALRRLVICGEIPSVKVGKKYLINLEILEKFLSLDKNITAQTEKPSQIQKIDTRRNLYANK